jgi:hypothetical protein
MSGWRGVMGSGVGTNCLEGGFRGRWYLAAVQSAIKPQDRRVCAEFD